MDGAEPPLCPSPSPYKPPSTLFKDISNFKTPKRPSKISNFHSPCPQFFTASKHTPWTNSSFRRRPSIAPSNSARTKAAVRRLKAVEFEQSQFSRKVQIRKEQSLKSLAKSLTVWLNFLFENPRSCGCNFPVDEDHGQTRRKGKRDSGSGVEVRVDAAWREPKRQRDSSWKGEDSESAGVFSSSKYSKLQSSLKLLCSFDDLVQRMRFYLSLGSCKEVFDSMIQVAKSIDEGRLKMKVHCPLVTDVGLRKKATKVLMSYNPIWLRIGLYVIFGGDSLLSDRDVNSDEEVAFLKMIIEKQLFAHAGLAKEYAYNKKVEGLYRPGYYEALGNVILKRFLLLVLILDRAKSQSSLSLKYGLDGVDGGSPLLFTVQSSIKSSHQVIQDFLSSDIMLGEGNVSAHLVILGYKVSHQQSPIVDFDFRVTDLFVDLQDGLRLCRAIQLLKDDSSILMKMAVPSDTHKKHLANCGTALQYLKEAGVVLHDDDGMMIVEDDIADGEKELTISLLWNMFVHLQLPLLVKKTTLAEEICKIRGNMDSFINADSPPLELLLNWIQAICEIYDCKIDSFSSLVDGKAIWCLLDYHFRKQLCCAWSSKDPNKSSHEESIMLATEYLDAVHNFLLSQKLMSLLGNFPEVLQISDILEYNGVPNDRSVVILLVFLSSQLIGKKNMGQLNFHKLLGCDCQSSERICSVRPEPAQIQKETRIQHTEDTGSVKNFKAIQAWWQDMAERNHKLPKPSAPTLQNFSTNKDEINISRVNAAKRIQSVLLIQRAARNWIMRKDQDRSIVTHNARIHDQANAAIVVQRYTRGWLARSRCIHGGSLIHKSSSIFQENGAPDVRTKAAVKIQLAWNYYVSLHNKHLAAIKIQSHFRSWLLRRRFHIQRQATIKIQSVLLMSRCWKAYQQYKIATVSATIIQSYVRGWVARREANQRRHLIVTIQRYCRGWLRRRYFLCQRIAVVKIQSAIRCLLYRQAFQRHRQAAVEIQRIVRGKISRSNLLGASCLHPVSPHGCLIKITSAFYSSVELNIVFCSVLKLQRWWRSVLSLKLRTKSAVLIQSHIREWFARQKASRERHCSVVIQSYWRGYQARKKESREQLKLRTKSAVLIQSHIREWLARQQGSRESHCSVVIQSYWRGYQARKKESREQLKLRTKAAVLIQSHVREWFARQKKASRERHCSVVIQSYWRGYQARKKESREQLKLRTKSAVLIQSHIREWLARQQGSRESHCSVVIQSYWRGYQARKKESREQLKLRTKAAVLIQSHVREWFARQKKASRERHCSVVIQSYWRGYQARKKESREQLKLRTKSAVLIQSHIREWLARQQGSRESHCSVVIQSYWRGYQARKKESREQLILRTKAAVLIQSHVREWFARQKASRERHCSVVIQSYWRGYQARKKESREQLKLRTKSAVLIQSHIREWLARQQGSRESHCSVVIQSYWRGYQARKKESREQLKLRTKAAVLIQSHVREWFARQKKASRERHCSVVIQSYWRGYQARKKESREQLKDLRLRVQKSSTSVDDSMRIINRLVAALSELLRMKSISNILHTCATLDMATRYSQKCCERLVDAGAIKTLLKLIRSGSRSIPDQEVLKHALSTLRNLARYPHLVEVLIDCEGSVQTVLWELLRNKEEGYFIASELLKKICSSHKGAEAVRKSPAHLKRLRSLVEELGRKSCNEKRNARFANARENTERRLKEAVVILKMTTES